MYVDLGGMFMWKANMIILHYISHLFNAYDDLPSWTLTRKYKSHENKGMKYKSLLVSAENTTTFTESS